MFLSTYMLVKKNNGYGQGNLLVSILPGACSIYIHAALRSPLSVQSPKSCIYAFVEFFMHAKTLISTIMLQTGSGF